MGSADLSISGQELCCYGCLLGQLWPWTQRSINPRKAAPEPFDWRSKCKQALWSLLAGVFVAAALIAGFLAYLSSHWLLHHPALAVQHIQVHGHKRLTEDMVIEASRLRFGISMITLQLEQLRQDILTLPWLKQVYIRRIWPHTIVLEVEEYQAVLLVALDRVYLADSHGILFKPFSALDAVDLPMLTFAEPELAASKLPELVGTAQHWLHASAALLAEIGIPDMLHYDTANGWTLHLRSAAFGSQLVAFHLGRRPVDRLSHVAGVWPWLLRQGKRPVQIWAGGETHPSRMQVTFAPPLREEMDGSKNRAIGSTGHRYDQN